MGPRRARGTDLIRQNGNPSVDAILDGSGLMVSTPGAADPTAIALFEELAGVPIPLSLRAMYETYGAVDCGPIRLLGLGVPVGHPADVLDALIDLDEAHRAAGLVPLERRTGGRVAAMAPDGRVVLVDGDQVAPGADGLDAYLADRIDRVQESRRAGWNWLRGAGTSFAREFDAQGTSVPNRIPVAHKWRPIRFCIQDVILGVVALKFDRRLGAVRVGPFVFTDVEGVPPGTGAEALTAIVVADAYRNGGDLRVRFDRGLPDGVLRTAENLGIALSGRDGLTADETRELLVRFSRVGPALEAAGLPHTLIESIAAQVDGIDEARC